MKIRQGFVSNSSSSSFIIYEYDEYSELCSYEITVGNESGNSSEEIEIFHAIAEEFGDSPSQDDMDIITTDIPKTWEKYEFKIKKYLKMKLPLSLSFWEIFEIMKKFKVEEKNED